MKHIIYKAFTKSIFYCFDIYILLFTYCIGEWGFILTKSYQYKMKFENVWVAFIMCKLMDFIDY